MSKKLIIFSIFFLMIAIPVSARDYISDWYIKTFNADIVVNKDSTLVITESIVADCDNLPDKHGIFRILPTQIKTTQGTIITPIELISITDFFGKSIKYSTIIDATNHTITWKIGDPDVVVHGENQYRIKYKVKNVIRFGNQNFDELYWNLNGNFWDIVTDSFVATIYFPSEITKNNTVIDYYTGYLNEKGKDLAIYRWTGLNVLEFYSTNTLLARQGITASITFPKNIFMPYRLGIFEKYDEYSGLILFSLLTIIIFIACLIIWNKYGKDPQMHKTIVPEFEIPENLTPMEMGMLQSNGRFNNKFISATIVDLAVKGYVSIEETEGTGLFAKKDYFLKKTIPVSGIVLAPAEQLVFDKLFAFSASPAFNIFLSFKGVKEERIKDGGVYLSSLKKYFYKNIPQISKSAKDDLLVKKLITKQGLFLKGLFITLSYFMPWIFTAIGGRLAVYPGIVATLIIIGFSFIMPRRTMKGAEFNWRVKGFKLYMNTAEKYRQQFNEKENIFEKYLPYAIVFNMTKIWAKKMQEIYGEEYFKNYHPIWFTGAVMGSFDVDSFTSHINSLSSGIASSVGGPSGAGGAGGAGGGGGGGGGGGW